MSEHHRKMIRYSLSHMKFIEEQIQEIDEAIAAKIHEAGLDRQWENLQTVPGFAGAERRQHSSRDGGGYDAVSDAAAYQFVGRSVPRKQPKCGQEPQQSHHGGQPLAARCAYGMCLGGSREEELLPERKILADHHQIER